MKKALYAFLSISLIALPAVAFGVEALPTGPTTIDQFILILNTLANWVFSILLVVAVIFILLAAFKFVTAGGNASEVGSARQMLLYAAIGIIVAVAAKGIVAVAKSLVQ